MSAASRERQLRKAETTENWEGMFNFHKTRRRKLTARRFRPGTRGTIRGAW